QVSDPTQSMRFSEDQARDPNGKFASGSQSGHKPDEQAKSKGTEHVNEHSGRAPGLVESNDKSIEHAQAISEHMNEAIKEGNVNAYSAMSAAKNALGGLPVKGNQQNRKPASDEQKRRMKEMLRNGYTHAEAAEKLGLKYDEFGRLHQKPPKVVDVDEHLAALDEY